MKKAKIEKQHKIKILYFMGVPWGFIKQRNHFIAEYLNEDFKVTALTEKVWRDKGFVKNTINNGLKIRELCCLPLSRYKPINFLTNQIKKLQLKKYIKNQDIIWIIDPRSFKLVHDIIQPDQKLIYDCMDDQLEFPYVKKDQKIFKEFYQWEKLLVNKADVVFSSSSFLKNKLISRYNLNREINIINNAVHLDQNTNHNNKSKQLISKIQDKTKKYSHKISYIGNISEWMNFDLILESLDNHQDIAYLFFGPSEVKIPEHERIFHFGSIEHQLIFDVMEASDVLIMPFKLDELIKSVNPVKLYEYIYSGKPIIALKYDETLKFNDYVYLYENNEEFLNYIEKLVSGNLLSKKCVEKCISFAKENTWDNRVKSIANILKNLE